VRETGRFVEAEPQFVSSAHDVMLSNWNLAANKLATWLEESFE
jgi:hypothetical protein